MSRSDTAVMMATSPVLAARGRRRGLGPGEIHSAWRRDGTLHSRCASPSPDENILVCPPSRAVVLPMGKHGSAPIRGLWSSPQSGGQRQRPSARTRPCYAQCRRGRLWMPAMTMATKPGRGTWSARKVKTISAMMLISASHQRAIGIRSPLPALSTSHQPPPHLFADGVAMGQVGPWWTCVLRCCRRFCVRARSGACSVLLRVSTRKEASRARVQ